MKNRTLNWLRQQCTDSLLDEKWLLCDNMRTGQILKDRINLAGTPTVNLHAKTLRSIVLSVVSESLATSNLTYLGSSAAKSLVHDLITQASKNSELEACNWRVLFG